MNSLWFPYDFPYVPITRSQGLQVWQPLRTTCKKNLGRLTRLWLKADRNSPNGPQRFRWGKYWDRDLGTWLGTGMGNIDEYSLFVHYINIYKVCVYFFLPENGEFQFMAMFIGKLMITQVTPFLGGLTVPSSQFFHHADPVADGMALFARQNKKDSTTTWRMDRTWLASCGCWWSRKWRCWCWQSWWYPLVIKHGSGIHIPIFLDHVSHKSPDYRGCSMPCLFTGE